VHVCDYGSMSASEACGCVYATHLNKPVSMASGWPGNGENKISTRAHNHTHTCTYNYTHTQSHTQLQNHTITNPHNHALIPSHNHNLTNTVPHTLSHYHSHNTHTHTHSRSHTHSHTPFYNRKKKRAAMQGFLQLLLPAQKRLVLVG